MIKTQSEISKDMRDQLRIQDPEISLEPGTPERMLIDVVAQEIAEANGSIALDEYKFSIDTKMGADLDDYLSNFGFSRQAGVRASGRVIFSTALPTPSPIFIPAGTQVMKPSNAIYPRVVFQTITDAFIAEGDTFVEVPVEAVLPGDVGNVPSNTITSIGSPIAGVSAVWNALATQGGSEEETDAEFVTRFRNTNLRNISGTNDQILALALAAEMTTKANVIGAVSKFSEYIQLDNNHEATSQNPHSKYIYDYDYFLTSSGEETGSIYTPDIDYFFYSDTTAPEILATAALYNPPQYPALVEVSNNNGPLIGTYQWAYTFVYQEINTEGVEVLGESSLSPPVELSVNTIPSSVDVTVPNGRGWNIFFTGTPGGSDTYKLKFTLGSDEWTTGTIEFQDTLPTIEGKILSALSLSPGDIEVDNYSLDIENYRITFTEDYTEDPTGIVPIVEIVDDNLSGGDVFVSSHVVERRVYRKIAGLWSLVHTITDNSTFTFTDSTLLTGAEPPKEGLFPGSILFLEHSYLSKNSRNHINDVINLYILNKIDVFLNGESIASAKDVIPPPNIDVGDPNNVLFNTVGSSKYNVNNYRRVNDLTHPTPGNAFLNLIWTPVTMVPSTITIGDNVYALNDDYWFVKDTTLLRGSRRARDGIEISIGMAEDIQLSRFVINYAFNRVPAVINRVIDEQSLSGQDILVHEADRRWFNVNLVVMYQRGANRYDTRLTLEQSLASFFSGLNFGDVIQISDVLSVVRGVGGIDNARLATSADDPVSYGIQEINSIGGHVANYETDFYLSDSELATFNALGPNGAPIERSQNTWVGGL